jgi:beta-xylosidase
MTTPTEEYEKKSLNLQIPTLWNEGTTVIKRENEYIMNYSANCYATNDYAICLAVSNSPLGPWVKPEDNPVLSCREDLFGAGHNAFFYGKDGALYTSFHIQTDPEHPSGDRRTVIGKVNISLSDNGLIETIE